MCTNQVLHIPHSNPIFLLSGLNIVDYIETKVATAWGAVEMNPIVNFALQNGLFEVLKLAATILLIVSVYGLYRLEKKWGYYAGYVTLGWYTFVVLSNLIQLFI